MRALFLFVCVGCGQPCLWLSCRSAVGSYGATAPGCRGAGGAAGLIAPVSSTVELVTVLEGEWRRRQ